ncbi:MAG TPA: class I SAM-dependent methyltransferase [Polyangiaceae bacterium]|nr:class I SAM-dependent methyltransferase [Polyangiaceae bacterium]
MKAGEHYTFGDGDVAAERLRLLARVFEPSSSRLLRSLGRPGGALALDLGCGPGSTTRLLAEHVESERVLGLDQSARLLAQATREQGSTRVSFLECDVSTPPFTLPAAAATVLYSRFLLTHLREPAQVIRAWASVAEPNALLVLEETAFMTGEHSAFPRYYALVERMQAHYGQRMYIGRELAELTLCDEWSRESADISVAPLPAADMARLHWLNLSTWSNDAFAQQHYDRNQLSALGEELAQIAAGDISAPPVSCGIGQVVLRRR